MAIVNSRQKLIDYALRNLGAPVIEINVDEDQIEDRIDEAIQFYQEYHSDAVVRIYRKHQVTSTDITNRYITLPDNFLFVNRVFPFNTSQEGTSMFSLDYQLHLQDVYSLRQPGLLVNYEMTKQYMSMIDRNINGMQELTTFSRHQNRLYIETQWGDTIGEN